MTEQYKLQIPRMVWVQDAIGAGWVKRELLADLSAYTLDAPFICLEQATEGTSSWKYMREIEPEPEKPYMTPRQLLDAIRGGAVWCTKLARSVVRVYWDNAISVNNIEICYDWHGDESDVWEEARVK